jgi:hypothetical protein
LRQAVPFWRKTKVGILQVVLQLAHYQHVASVFQRHDSRWPNEVLGAKIIRQGATKPLSSSMEKEL